MRRTVTTRWVLGVFLTLMFGAVPRAYGQVKVVDITPNDFSDETRHNSEPYIAVNSDQPEHHRGERIHADARRLAERPAVGVLRWWNDLGVEKHHSFQSRFVLQHR